MMDEFSLTGKTALIAGSSRGIGLAIAQSLSRAGADTILAARSIDALRKATDALRAEGSSSRECMLDISSSKSIRTAVSSLPDIDILINAAGMNLRKRFQDYTREEYDRLLQTNLHGIVELTQQVGEK